MSRKKIHTTREAWLHEACELLSPLLLAQGHKVPEKLQVSVGYPKSKAKTAIGVCHSPEWTTDGTTHIFISPVLGDSEERILDVLLHELIHAAVGCECGHRNPFKKVAKALGLEGKPTATYVTEGTDLHKELVTIADKLGTFAHSVMNAPLGIAKRKPGGGWIKLTSKSEPAYILRISAKAYREFGAPSDPWGEPMRSEDDDEGGDED